MNISRRNLFLGGLTTTSCAAFCESASPVVRAETNGAEEDGTFFKLYPVGVVNKQSNSATLHIHERYSDALKGLDGFSHAFVLYWFDRNDTREKRRVLQVCLRGNKNNPLTGVSACRSPVRPNLLALSLCKILSIRGGTLSIDRIDALDGSPILDIKPYIPSIDCEAKMVRVPDWLKD